MFNNIFLKTLRDQFYPVLWWSVGFIFISIYLSYFYPYISNNTGIFKMIESLPPFIKNLFGDTDFITSPAGFFNLQPFTFFAPILILFFSISKGVGVIAGEKEDGTLDLLLSKPVSRNKLIIHKTLSLSLGLLIIHVFFWSGMVIGITIFKIDLNILKLAEAILSLFMLSLSFLTISILAGLIFLNRKKAVGLVSGFALISFILNAYAPAIKAFHLIRFFSPFYYNSGNSPIVNGIDLQSALTQGVIAVFFFLLSLIMFRKRDLYI